MSTAQWQTLRELDTRQGWPKGTAFRRFKQLEPQLREGLDYQVLRPEQAEFSQWRERLYPGAQRAILLPRAVAERLSGVG